MRFLLISFFMTVLLACNQVGKTVQFPKDKFDAIEKIVGTDNWQLVDGQDTSYLYFSRTGVVHFNIYHYWIVKGDSVGTRMNNITDQEDAVAWNRGDEKLILADVDNNVIIWKNISNDKDRYVLKKTDSLHLSFILPDGHTSIMTRTLPLGTFLIRKRYDYLHGTSYADSPEVKSRGPVLN